MSETSSAGLSPIELSAAQSPPVELPQRPVDAHKGDFGRAWLVGGSRGMSGSIALSSIAALYSGAGSVTAAVPDRCLETVAGFHPAIMTVALTDDQQGRFSEPAGTQLAGYLRSATAIGCGPGMTTAPGARRIVERLLSISSLPRVMDADALNSLAMLGMLPAADNGPLILTPHPGELQRLTGAPSGDRPVQIEAARKLAATHMIIVVVKGGPTVVVDEKHCWTNPTGNPGMATAGSGDILTGVITGLLAQKLSPWDAARLGVWVHGRAGDLAAQQQGQAALTAIEILAAIPTALNEATAK